MVIKLVARSLLSGKGEGERESDGELSSAEGELQWREETGP